MYALADRRGGRTLPRAILAHTPKLSPTEMASVRVSIKALDSAIRIVADPGKPSQAFASNFLSSVINDPDLHPAPQASTGPVIWDSDQPTWSDTEGAIVGSQGADEGCCAFRKLQGPDGVEIVERLEIQEMRSSSSIHSFFGLLRALDDAKLSYHIDRHRTDSVTVTIALVGERTEVDVFEDGHMEVSRFRGDESVEGGRELAFRIIDEALRN